MNAPTNEYTIFITSKTMGLNKTIIKTGEHGSPLQHKLHKQLQIFARAKFVIHYKIYLYELGTAARRAFIGRPQVTAEFI